MPEACYDKPRCASSTQAAALKGSSMRAHMVVVLARKGCPGG